MSVSLDPPFLGKLIPIYLVPAQPSPTLKKVLDIAGRQDRRIQDLVPDLSNNALYEDAVLSISAIQDKINRWVADEGKENLRKSVILDRVLALLGRSAIRNWLTDVRLGVVTQRGIPRKKTDRWALAPREDLGFALAAEEFILDRSMAHSDLAYVAALHLDWIRAIASARKGFGDSKVYFDVVFKEALKIGRMAYTLGGLVKMDQFERALFSGPLLIAAGKGLLSVLFPKDAGANSWQNYVGESEKSVGFQETLQWVTEKQRFPITHSEAAGLVATTWGIFQDVERALVHYREPYYLKSLNPNLYRLAALWFLSDFYVRSRLRNEKKPNETAIIQNTLKELKLKPEQITHALDLAFAEPGKQGGEKK